MPHKKNPITSENISGLARVLRGYAATALENIALWHERDISHSSVERIILADATTLLDHMLSKYEGVLKNLVVNTGQMTQNIEMTQGVVFAQYVLNELIDRGMNRQEGYDLVQRLAKEALIQKISFRGLLEKQTVLQSFLDANALNRIFSIEKHLKYVDTIYQVVFKV